MPTAKFYRNGLTMGMGGNPQPVGGKRGKVDGWSTSAVRRHTRWLYSVNTDELTGHGWSLTLTVRDCPDTPEKWTAVRERFLRLTRESGILLRLHWVVEWTRRKVPHMHLAVYLSEELPRDDVEKLLVDTWVSVAGEFGTIAKAQHLAPIDGALGWLEYLSKHAARGVSHYQRNGKPAGWDRTGRLWGHTGSWPLDEPAEANLTRSEFFRFRRLVRSWRVADARKSVRAGSSSPKRITSARSMLKCSDLALSQVRGVSEWIPEAIGLSLLLTAAGDAAGARDALRQHVARPPRSPQRQALTSESW